MPDPVRPGPESDSLADVVELLLDKGIVINADIVVSVGETELLGVKLRAAIASFETASEYGLEFPSGTDMEAVEAASERRRKREVTPAANPELSPSGDYSEVDEATEPSETEADGGTETEADNEAESEADNEAESEADGGTEADSADRTGTDSADETEAESGGGDE